MKQLLEKGADAQVSTFPAPILVAAVQLADVYMIKLLLQAGCDTNILDPKYVLIFSFIVYAHHLVIQIMQKI